MKTVREIPESNYDIDGDTNILDDKKIEKKKLKTDNENTFSDLLMSIDYSTPQGKTAFRLVQSYITAKYKDGHAGHAWDKLITKFQPRTGPTLAKTQGGRPDEWITELEKYRMEMEEIKSTMTDQQFLVHIMNSLTADYDLE
jgi:hypothetical protein